MEAGQGCVYSDPPQKGDQAEATGHDGFRHWRGRYRYTLHTYVHLSCNVGT